MTFEAWAIFIIFLLSNCIALGMLEASSRADKKLEEAQKENDRLKNENEDLKREIRKMEIMALVNEFTYGGSK